MMVLGKESRHKDFAQDGRVGYFSNHPHNEADGHRDREEQRPSRDRKETEQEKRAPRIVDRDRMRPLLHVRLCFLNCVMNQPPA